MKVCSLYGAGYYYLPGTDICLKVGGYVRFQTYWNGGIQPGFGPWGGQGQVQQSRQFNASNDLVYRTRSIATFDTRQQTAYGTLRTYLILGFTHENGTGNGGLTGANVATLYATRGFIQIAGFTFGKATSFFDFYQGAAVGYTVTHVSSDTGDGGHNVAAYTAQLGNGVSATIAAEDARNMPVTNMSLTANQFIVGNNLGTNNGSTLTPDVVANIRVDQAWGSAAVMGAYHRVSGAYYGTTATGAAVNGGPDAETGWVVGAGLRLNAPMIGPGDFFQTQVMYTHGAGKYVSNTPPSGGSLAKFDGNEIGVGWWSDGVYTSPAGATGGSIELTTAWGITASYEHFWTPSLRTSAYGGYMEWRYNDKATAAICANIAADAAGALSGVSNCNPDFNFWFVGSRSQWNITKDLYVGVDVMYQKLESGFQGTGTFTAAAGLPQPTGTYRITDQDNLLASWRIHRDIIP